MSTQKTVLASELADYVAQSDESVSIVGDAGGEALITGSIYDSSALPGLIVIETEVGSLYVGEESSIEVA